jgi:hypothetical protein
VSRALERLAIVVAALALAVGLIALLSGFFAGRDRAGIAGETSGPGRALPDLGHAMLRLGQPHPRYNSSPPTSGAHLPEPVRQNEARLTDDQILQALALGDVLTRTGPAFRRPACSRFRARWRLASPPPWPPPARR